MTEGDGGGRGGTGRRIALGVVVFLLIGGTAWRIVGRSRAMAALAEETNELATTTVSVVTPASRAPEEEIVLPGTIQAYEDAPIYARTSGYLRRRTGELGMKVRAGQLLAEIDAPELEQQLEQARADLATAEANVRLAQITADRYADLLRTDSVSQQDADNASGALEARKAAVESARHNAERLQELRAFTRIYAPFAGVITARNTDVGALIDAGASGGAARELFHIASTDRLRVFVNLPQAYVQVARPGVPAELTLAEFPGRRFGGSLVRRSESIDVTSRTLLVEVEVANAAGELLPGAYAEVHFKLPRPEAALLLPVNTLIFRGEGARVALVKDDSRVQLVRVTLGRDFGTEVEVLEGLTGREAVVASPPDSLLDGQAVRVQKGSSGERGSGGGAR
jgi:RND family efflux transporter MFP subunit